MLVLNRAEVGRLIKSIRPDDLCTLMAKTLFAACQPVHIETSPGTAAIQAPLRLVTTTDDCTMLYMPARLSTAQNASMTAIKCVGVPKPHATEAKGLPGTTLLFDEATGACKAMINSSDLTGLRTAAASALTVKLLTPEHVHSFVVFGTGIQAYFHALLICSIRPSLRRLSLVCRRVTERARGLATRLASELPSVEIELIDSGESVTKRVREAQIISTCVPSTAPLFSVDDLPEQVHITAIGSYKPHMQEFPPELIGRDKAVPRVVVDSRSACLAEAGEIIASGIAAEDLIELGTLVDKDGKPGDSLSTLTGARQTLFKSVGVGAMDVAIAHTVHELARALQVGQDLIFE